MDPGILVLAKDGIEFLPKLLDVIKSAIGAVAEPTLIERRALANFDAKIIDAFADAYTRELAQETAHRMYIQEMRHQENYRAIKRIAKENGPPIASKDPVDLDWLNQFFDECKDVSNDDMQAVCGKILAGEVAQPRSFSRRTLSVVRQLTSDDLQAFARLCSLCWSQSGTNHFVIEPPTGISRYGVSTDDLLTLESAGLVFMKRDLAVMPPPGVVLAYQSQSLLWTLAPRAFNAKILTRAGNELYPIIADKASNAEYFGISSVILSQAYECGSVANVADAV